MRSSLSTISFAVIGLLALSGLALAALQEKPVLDDINNTAATLRYLHKQIAEAQGNLDIVRAARDLTQRQLQAQQQLFDRATEAGEEAQAKFYQNRLRRLQEQITRLNEFDFEQIYNARIEAARKQIKELTPSLEARMKEFEALFGKKPDVDLSVEDIYERYGKRRADAAYYLDLDGS